MQMRGWGRALGVGILMVCHPVTAGTQNPSSGERLTQLIARAEGTYIRLSANSWQTSYSGRNIHTIDVRIATADGGVFLFIDLADRSKLTLTEDLLQKVAELNAQFDYVKLGLSKTTLQLRLDTREQLLDLEEFKMLEKQAATAADEAYGALKTYLP
jgi:hypothetical protein